MKKMIAFGILLFALLVSTLASVSAYHYNTDNNYCRYDCIDRSPDGTLYVVDFHGIDRYRYRYVDYYGYPRYRVYYAKDFDDFDIPDRYKFNENIYFLDHSFNDRYDITRGKTSGQAFCPDCKDDHYDPSNWRYKQAYDLQKDAYGGYGDGYYTPRYNYKSGTYNWRY